MPAPRESITGAIVCHWWLLAAVTAAQLTAAVALRLLPFAALRAATRRSRHLARFFVRDSNERVAWAIEGTGRRLGRISSCLARAVVADLLLDSADGRVCLWIGVRRASAGDLEAHAWVTRDDRVLVGGPVDGYAPIVTWARDLE